MRNIEKFYKTYACDQNGIFTLEGDTILFKYEDDDALYYKGYYYLRHNSKVTDEKRFTLTNLSDFDVHMKEISTKDFLEFLAKKCISCEITFTNGDGNLYKDFSGIGINNETISMYNEDDEWVKCIINDTFKIHDFAYVDIVSTMADDFNEPCWETKQYSDKCDCDICNHQFDCDRSTVKQI